mgnify:CR=1 FL=1
MIIHDRISGKSLNTAHACTAGAFANDFEHTDLSSIAYMAAAAEHHGEVRNGNNANNIAVFFTEESSSTLLLSFLNRQLFNINSFASQNLLVDNSLNLLQLLSSNLREVGEVKTQNGPDDIAAGLA